ncbi:MAG: FG-GAP-like repeat-containing protein [Bacteroidia bacterium]|nr:FG-GAP-like repeat-containing protein [Bacteroidia bacterium]
MKRILQKRQILICFLILLTIDLWPQTFTDSGISLPGVSSSSVAWGDYDNDGDQDILLSGQSASGYISKIYRNEGSNIFTEQTGISLTGVTTGSVSWADYDNDGDQDILLTGWFTGSYLARIWRNNGDNTFTEQSDISLTGVSNSSAAWADYDNDGDLDLLVAGNGPLGLSPRIYRNNGNNTFAEETGISLSGASSGSVAWGDYDNDGDLDILMSGASESGYITKIYLNNGNNSFTEQTGISLTGVNFGSVAWGDYDNDGNLDILLTGQQPSGAVSKIYHNNGNSTFTEQTGISLKNVDLSSVAWGDYNNDGNMDILLTGESDSGRVSKIYCNNGDNTFTELTGISLAGVYQSACAWGDYDNDGDLDILLTGKDENDNIISKIYRNNIVTANTRPSAPANLQTVVNNGIVTFKWDKATDSQTPADGLSYNLYVYESGQSNYKCPPHAFRESDALNGMRLISKNGNIQWNANGYTLKDLAPDKTYYWSVQAIDGGFLGGNFAAEQSFTVPLFRPHEQANCIKVTNIQDNQATVTWAGGGGTKRALFIKPATSGTADPVDNTTYDINSLTPGGWECVYNGTECTTVITGLTVNTDYMIQVVEYNGTTGNEMYLTTTDIKNPASFSTVFTEQSGIALRPTTNTAASWGDYDNDEYLDILLSGFTYDGCRSMIFRNNGDNTFTEQTGIEMEGVTYSSAAWGDYDNDSLLDVLLTGLQWASPSPFYYSKIYKNNGDNTFTEQKGISLPGVISGSVAWGDYDKDGFQDFLLTGQTSSGYISKIYRNNQDNTFTEQKGISLTGVWLSSVSWGDYDNDGNLDILLTGAAGSGPISKIYRNNGNNTFTEQTGISLQRVQNSSAAWGDYDNDGYLDILLTGTNLVNYSKIYHNNGDNTFTELTGISLISVSSGSAAWGDYDNDGDLDVLLTGNSSSGSVSKIYRNNGDNTFNDQTNILFPGVSASSVAWGDYDNDGDLDLLITGQEATNNFISKVYKNNCTQTNKNPDQPKNLSYEIRNKDALLKWDRVTTDETSTKSLTYNIRVGRKSGSSEVVSPQAASGGFRRVAAMGNNQLDTIFTFKNLRWDTTYYASVQAVDNSFKGGPFSDEVHFKISPVQPSQLSATHISNSSVLLKWKRGNGDRCIVFAKEGNNGTSNPLNNTTFYANSVFGEGSPLGTGWYCIYKGEADSVLLSGLNPQINYIIHAIEFQGKVGSEIYAKTVTTENIFIFSAGLFTEQANIVITGVQQGSVAWGDYDNDGFTDFLLTGQDTAGNFVSKIYRNNGDNTFTEQTTVSLPGVINSSVAWGDFNNDGYLDILLTGFTKTISPWTGISKIFKNNGDNTFSEQTGLSLKGVSTSSAALGDYDNDGYLDILLTGYSGSNGISKIYHNNGDDTFTEQTTVSLTGVQLSSTAWGDYDSDGYLDILLAGSDANYPNYNPITKIYHNNGDNTFTPLTGVSLRGLYQGSVSWCDYNNDCKQDILLTGYSYSTWTGIAKIYKNDGSNSFTEQTGISLTGVYLSSAAWGDYDNDGYPDILLTGTAEKWPNYNPVSKIYHNNGDNTFSEQTGMSLAGVYNSSVAWSDYDNDGDLDILLAGLDENGSAISRLYRNNLIMKAGVSKSNVRPDAPTGLSSSVTPGNIKVTWIPVSNDETPAKTMSYNLRYKFKNETRWKFAPEAEENGYRGIPAMGNIQLNKSFNLRNLPSGTYYWQIQAVDQGYAGGVWSAVDSFVVRNTQAFFNADTVCQGLPTNFTDQSVSEDGIASWKWDFNDGTTSVIQNPSHIFPAGGAYNVKLVITSNAGIKDSLEKSIIVKFKPVTGFNALTTCQGTPTAITNNTIINGLTITTWEWDFGDGQSSTIQQPAAHGFLNAGDYSIKLKAVADNGCADSTKKTVTVGSYPIAAITTSSSLTFCEGDSIVLSVGNNSNYFYQWLIEGTGITNGDSSSYVAKSSGKYSVEVVNLKGNCKTTSSEVTVTAKDTPYKPVLASPDYQQGRCPGVDPVRLSADQSVTGYHYLWYKDGQPRLNDTLSYLDLYEKGLYRLEANLKGCKAESGIFTIDFPDAPVKPLLYVRGPVVWYMASSNNNADYYRWYRNNELITGANRFIYVANKTLGTYKVAIGNESECFTFSDEIAIPISKSEMTNFYIPKEYLVGEDIDLFESLKIYPNPTPGVFTIDMNNDVFGELSVDILSEQGKDILNIKFDKTTEHFSREIDMSGQPEGLYILNLFIDKYFATRKVIVE